MNVGARQAPGSLDRDDLLDLLQHEAEPLRLPDERQQVQGVSAVDAVAAAVRRGGARMPAASYTRSAFRLAPQCFATSPMNRPFLLMATMVDPAPRGKVKPRGRRRLAVGSRCALARRAEGREFAAVAEALGSSVPRTLAGIRILVVEDDDDNREVLAYALDVEGATVTAVSRAREALPFLSSVDIILTDFVMPGEDGVWLLEQVNMRPRPIPVIAFSGFDEGQQPRLAAAPFAGKLLKPLDSGQVCAEIAVVLGNRA
jgi:CheY-like chemotaxis protein